MHFRLESGLDDIRIVIHFLSNVAIRDLRSGRHQADCLVDFSGLNHNLEIIQDPLSGPVCNVVQKSTSQGYSGTGTVVQKEFQHVNKEFHHESGACK